MDNNSYVIHKGLGTVYMHVKLNLFEFHMYYAFITKSKCFYNSHIFQVGFQITLNGIHCRCGLVVRVPGYRSRGGFESGTTRFSDQ
jgi:hypothetical protein